MANVLKTSTPVYQTVNNLRFPTFFPRENIEFALKYKPLDTDKFVVTYPKCGTTWTQQIICLIINDGKPLQNIRECLLNPFIEEKGIDSIKTLLNQRIFKTHLPFELMPYNKQSKYLCVFRNPKDACVSYYYHMKKLVYYQFDGDFHQFFKLFIKGEIDYGDYFKHVLTFWSHRFDDNFDFLVYENMKNNLRDAVLKIAQFLGDQYVVKLKENNESILEKVIESSSVDSMKSSLKTNPFDVLIRKGIVGDWKSHFNEDESDLIDYKVKQFFTGTGLEELWAEDIKW